jgi:serine/threonine protein kinase
MMDFLRRLFGMSSTEDVEAKSAVPREMARRDFEREANTLAELSHRAIPKIYDYFSQEDQAYLVMEYINGKDLETIVNSAPGFLPFDRVWRWVLEICDALAYLHTHWPEPISFRDMKPSNVMIDLQGHVKLIGFGFQLVETFATWDFDRDFGFSEELKVPDLTSSPLIPFLLQPHRGNWRCISREMAFPRLRKRVNIARISLLRRKAAMIGTEGYAPPEQYRGEVSPASDVYALGATLHHILTRRDPRLEPPFSFAERPIRQINPVVPAEFEAIVMRALAYEPAQRYPNAKAIKDAIEGLTLPRPNCSSECKNR